MPKIKHSAAKPRVHKSGMVAFALEFPAAEEVYLTGDFNVWARSTLPMRRNPQTSRWEKSLPLAPGRYEYKFVVDGKWIHDPQAAENVPNTFGTLNSVRTVAGEVMSGT